MITRAVFLALILALAGVNAWQAVRINALTNSVSQVRQSVGLVEAQLGNVASSSAAAISAASAETARRGQIVAKSQDQLLQDAVAAATPAVVSIVESQEVPLLQVTYENPFGNDPFFQGFGVQVPVYHQVGTTTQQVSAGTGFIVRGSGYIVTNKHVVPDTNATYTVLLSNGKQREGSVVWRSATEDLAVVKITGSGYTTIPLGDSSSLKLGESVFAVGNALGQYNNSVSVGIVSGLNRSIQAQGSSGEVEQLSNVIQTDAAINPGNSGGPLVNLAGQAVGISVATVSGSQSIGFAIPINEIKKALTQLGI